MNLPARAALASEAVPAATPEALLPPVGGDGCEGLVILWRAPLPGRVATSIASTPESIVVTTPRGVLGFDHQGRQRFSLQVPAPAGLAVMTPAGVAHLEARRIVLRDETTGREIWHRDAGGFALPAATPGGLSWLETSPERARLVSVAVDGTVRWAAALTEPAPIAPVPVGDLVAVIARGRLRAFAGISGAEALDLELPSDGGPPEDAPVSFLGAVSDQRVLAVRGRLLIVTDLSTGRVEAALASAGVRSPCALLGSSAAARFFMTGPRADASLGSSALIGVVLHTSGEEQARVQLPDVPRSLLGGRFGLVLSFGPEIDRLDEYGTVAAFENATRLVHLDSSGHKQGQWFLPGAPTRHLHLTGQGQLLVPLDGELLALRLPVLAGPAPGA